MNRCFLALGSNQKNPERQLRLAISLLKKLPKTSIGKVSSFHRTKAWGIQTQQDFCNAVIEIFTLLTPELLLRECIKVEEQQGRIRKKRWGPRILDIDIILFGQRRIHKKQLTIPHPHFLERDFVLNPLIEIYPAIFTYKPQNTETLNLTFLTDVSSCI
ncbi:MAG: 2-amino-4-hydroxy-6-hydroxymethyldihydropteridine diphosphokinase [Legionella sp.]|nr:MAG: 2-amino-4-hydroxy-6-hydroxymethyldihydropteridine diphosphokinase [Legionella sp.]